MLINIPDAKIIVSPHSVVVRLEGESKISMEAQAEVIDLIGRGANVISANSGHSRWSIKLENREQLELIARELGLPIE